MKLDGNTPANKAWFFYVVRCDDGTFYAGVTTDVSRRINEHNESKKGAKYTRARRPVKLVYCTDFCSRSIAQKAECYFKKLTRQEKEEILRVNENR